MTYDIVPIEHDLQVEEGERRRVEEEIKRQEADERHQKLVNEFRKLGEEYAALQVCFVFCRVHDSLQHCRLTIC